MCLWPLCRQGLHHVLQVLHWTAFRRVTVGTARPGVMEPLGAQNSPWCDNGVSCVHTVILWMLLQESEIQKEPIVFQSYKASPVNLRMSCVTVCKTSCSDSVSMYSDSCPAIQPHNMWPYLPQNNIANKIFCYLKTTVVFSPLGLQTVQWVSVQWSQTTSLSRILVYWELL